MNSISMADGNRVVNIYLSNIMFLLKKIVA